jgi:hypothetical protein
LFADSRIGSQDERVDKAMLGLGTGILAPMTAESNGDIVEDGDFLEFPFGLAVSLPSCPAEYTFACILSWEVPQSLRFLYKA